jgi:hypothetical protein
VHHKGLTCRTVLMDTWYATKELMLFIESLGKIYCDCSAPVGAIKLL